MGGGGVYSKIAPASIIVYCAMKNLQQTTTRQLKIAFSARSTLRQNLYDGQFSVLVELNPPGAEQPFKLALAPMHELLKLVNGDPRLASVAIRERDAADPAHSLAEFHRALRESSQKEMIVTLTGRGQTASGRLL